MQDKLKSIFIDALENHDWNYERHTDSKFDIGVKQKEQIRSVVAEAYEMGKDPAKIFYEFCPVEGIEEKEYGMKKSWQDTMDDIAKEANN